MGRSYWFECSKCGYGAKVCGRSDRGLNCFVQTISCCDCKELYDAIYRLKIPDEPLLTPSRSERDVARGSPLDSTFRQKKPRKGPAPSFQTVLNWLPYTGISRFKWLEFKLICPVSQIHKVATWNHPGECPKCGIFLEKNVIPFRVWD